MGLVAEPAHGAPRRPCEGHGPPPPGDTVNWCSLQGMYWQSPARCLRRPATQTCWEDGTPGRRRQPPHRPQKAPSSLLEASRPLLAPQPVRPNLRAWTRLQTSATSVPASKAHLLDLLLGALVPKRPPHPRALAPGRQVGPQPKALHGPPRPSHPSEPVLSQGRAMPRTSV